MKLHGIFPPIATPFDHKGDLYRVKVQHNVEKWNKTPLAGYAVCGSTGESVHLTTDEKIKMWEWVAEYADSSKILIAGTGVESVRETVALTNRAAELGYKVAMVRTPHYYKNLINRCDGASAVLPRRRRSGEYPGDDLQLAADYRRGHHAGSGGDAVRPSQHHRD